MNIKGDSELITKKFELNGTPYSVENFTAKLLDSNRKLIQNLDVTSPETGSYSFIITFPSNKEKVIVQYNYTENGIPKEEHWGISLTYYNGTIDFENDSTTPDLGWKHIHLNKEVLDGFSEVDGLLYYGNAPIATEIPAILKNFNEVDSKLYYNESPVLYDNYEVLTSFSDSNGELLYNGETIGSGLGNDYVLAKNYGTANNSERILLALSEIGNNNKKLFIDDIYTIDQNIVIPKNVTLEFSNSGFFNINDGIYIEIGGKFIAPKKLVFNNKRCIHRTSLLHQSAVTGDNIVTNSEFTDSSNWTLTGAGISISDNKLKIIRGEGYATSYIYQNLTGLILNAYYIVEYKVTKNINKPVFFMSGTCCFGANYTLSTDVGINRRILKVTNTANPIKFYCDSTNTELEVEYIKCIPILSQDTDRYEYNYTLPDGVPTGFESVIIPYYYNDGKDRRAIAFKDSLSGTNITSCSFDMNTKQISCKFPISTSYCDIDYPVKHGALFRNGEQVLPEWFGCKANDEDFDNTPYFNLATQSIIGTNGSVLLTEQDYYFQSSHANYFLTNAKISSNCNSNIIKRQIVKGANNNISDIMLMGVRTTVVPSGSLLYWEHLYNSNTGVRTVNIYKNSDGLDANKVATGASVTTTVRGGKNYTIDTATNIITLTSHGLSTAQTVRFRTDNTLPSPLVADTDYYVRVLSTNTFTLHPTKLNAYDNLNIIDLTDIGSGNQYLDYVSLRDTQTLFLTTTSGMSANSRFIIGKGTAKEEIVQPTSISTNYVGLLNPLKYDHYFTDAEVVETLTIKLNTYNSSNIYGFVKLLSGNITTDQNLASNTIKPFYGNNFFYFRYGKNITIENLNFKGYSTEDIGGMYVGDDCLQIDSCQNIRIQNNNFSNFADGVLRIATYSGLNEDNTDSRRILINNNIFDNCTQITMTPSSTEKGESEDIIFSNNIVTRHRSGLKWATRSEATNFIITNNIFKNCNTHLTLLSCKNVLISNNVFEDFQTFPLSIYTNNSSNYTPFQWENFTLTNNIFDNCAGGVSFSNSPFSNGEHYACNNVNISNNVFNEIYGVNSIINMGHGNMPNLKVNNNQFTSCVTNNIISIHHKSRTTDGLYDNISFIGNSITDCTTDYIINIFRKYVHETTPTWYGDRNKKGILIKDNISYSGSYFINIDSCNDILITNNLYGNSSGIFLTQSNVTNLSSTNNLINGVLT